MNSQYFSKMTDALERAGVAAPVLVIDKAKLDHNIACLKKTLDQGFAYRVVAKSLPSIPLLEYILSSTNSNRLMCFHLPFLSHIVEHRWTKPIDILLGKPMPAMAMKSFYQWFNAHSCDLEFEPEKQIQWLIDSRERLLEYHAFASEHHIKLKLNLEIDVGLHRGGFSHDQEFIECLETIKASDCLELGGLMGYDMHVSKAPSFLGGANYAGSRVKKRYEHFISLVDKVMGSHEGLCLNAAGSPTYSLYESPDQRNELSIASALVKPSDFDLPTLTNHEPAAYIATPILKTIDKPSIPILEKMTPLIRYARLFPKQACFIYGGNWLADPCYPQGSTLVKLFGHSSNQEMYSLPKDADIRVNDYMFFRPRQSEAVFLQFGKIALYDGGEITDWWPVFDASNAPRLSQQEYR